MILAKIKLAKQLEEIGYKLEGGFYEKHDKFIVVASTAGTIIEIVYNVSDTYHYKRSGVYNKEQLILLDNRLAKVLFYE